VPAADPQLLPRLAALGQALAFVVDDADRLVWKRDRPGLVRRVGRILSDLLAFTELGLDFL
jgi:hypothetical protein